MSYDELELDRIGDRKTAVFFTISDTTPTYNFIVALAFSQMFNLLCERADNVHGGRLPHHVRVLWDEAANTGQVPNLEKLVAVIRSREVSLCLFYQQLAQCKAIYDKHAETILGNMDSVIFLGGREASTIKEISENWLGKATISMQTEGRSRGQSESYNQNTQRLGREDKYYDVLAEIPRVRKDFGYPPLVTPTSQIVGTQAVMNVIVGKYKTFPKESKGLLRGEYGALPGEVNPEVRALAGIDPEEVITCRPADNIAPELETYKEQFKDIAKSEEDVLSLALFPQVAPKFLAWRDGPHETPAQPAEAPKAPPAGPNAVRELFVEYKF